jgi:mitotic spindle assembly checkpoint protein MAD2B
MPLQKHAEPKSHVSLVTYFLDFLTVCIHTILYERGVYPQEAFISARKYNYPVRQSRHPDLCDWINDAVKAIEGELLKGNVSRVAIVIFSKYDDPLERFVFDLSKFPVVNRRDWYIEFAARPENQSEVEKKVRSTNMDEQFRAVINKLAFCKRDLEPLPDDCSFNIAIELKDEAEPPIGNPQPWVPVQPSLQHEAPLHGLPPKTGEDIGGLQTTPLRTVEAGEMWFEMWIEEGRAKIADLEALGRPVYDSDDQEKPSEENTDSSMPSGSKEALSRNNAKGKKPLLEHLSQEHLSEENMEHRDGSDSLYDITPVPSQFS